MTDDDQGKSKDAQEETPPAASPSPPTPPPPDVSMFDEALEPLDMPDIVGEAPAQPRTGSNPDIAATGEQTSSEKQEDDEPDTLEAADTVDEQDELNAPESDGGEEAKSTRRRITLKIPDDDVPLSSPQPPAVEEAKTEVATPAAVVQAMRIISIGEAPPPSAEDPLEELEPEDQLDEMEPLGAHDVESTWTPPAGDAAPQSEVPAGEAAPQSEAAEEGDGEQLMSEEVVPIPNEPADEEAELEPELDEELAAPPPVDVTDAPEPATESPSPPPTAPLSPSASAPPPPSKASRAGVPVPAPVPLPSETVRREPSGVQRVADEPSALELSDDEIAPASTETPGEASPVVAPPPPRPPAPSASGEATASPRPAPAEAESPTPAPPSAEVPPPPPLDATPAPLDATPAPPDSRGRPPKAPPPKKRPKSELSKRERRARPGWEEVFADEFVRAYPRLTSKQVEAEVSFIEKRLGIQRGGVVLDLGCGSGQHAVELASRGYNVVGYDLSLTMLAAAADEAQERGQKINFLQGDMREMAFEEMFDGIFSWGTSFGFFDEEKNISVIQRVHRALRKGGMFLLDLINRDFVCARLPSLAWFEGDGCVCIDDAQFNAITSRLRVKRTIMVEDGTSREVEYSVRLYSLHEIGKILHEAGFKVVEVSGHPATEGAFFDAESPRCITLAVRR